MLHFRSLSGGTGSMSTTRDFMAIAYAATADRGANRSRSGTSAIPHTKDPDPQE